MKDLLFSCLYIATVLTELFLGAWIVRCFRQVVAAGWVENFHKDLSSLYWLIAVIPVLLLVVLFQHSLLFSWAEAQQTTRFKHLYFGAPFVAARALFCLAFWALIARWSLRSQSKNGGFILVLILLSGTIWVFDWVASLDGKFKSTSFGLIFLVSALLMTHAFMSARLRKANSVSELLDINTVHFALVGTWTYLTFIQYLVIWSGNLPEESLWYIHRSQAFWHVFPFLIFTFQSAIPLFVLLPRSWKSSVRFTRGIGLWSFFWQLVFCFWLVAPSIYPKSLPWFLLLLIPLGVLISKWRPASEASV